MTSPIFTTPSGRCIARVDSGFEFKSLGDEAYREYVYPEGSPQRVNNPVALRVSASGGHYVVDGDDLVHYFPVGWRRLTWKARDGVPLVAF